MRCLRGKSTAFAVLLCAACAFSARAQDPEQRTEEQMRDFLLHAQVVKTKQVSKGLTGISRLTLSDGAIAHDAAFQSIDESGSKMQNEIGESEMNFRDSYRYNIAAFELAKLLGLDDMMPVTVERRWSGKTGSFGAGHLELIVCATVILPRSMTCAGQRPSSRLCGTIPRTRNILPINF